MNRFWSAAQASLLFLDPETAHEASLRALEAGVYPRQTKPEDQRLAQSLFGLPFPNPVGVAAGYDKDARVYNALFGIGFGFAEAGTITPKPQAGNPRPRVLRLMRERGIINRLGFNSAGHSAALVKLASRPPRGVLGVNIGANRDSSDPIADYVAGVRAFGSLASYLTVNISSPNTPGLRDLQAPDRLNALLESVMAARASLGRAAPILVKLAPDLHDEDIAPVMECLLAHKVDGVILTNTTLSREGIPAEFASKRIWRPFGKTVVQTIHALPREVLPCNGRQAAAYRRWRHRLRRGRHRESPCWRVTRPAIHGPCL